MKYQSKSKPEKERRNMSYIYINDRFVEEQEACISPFDRGFVYGDGIFETIKADKGEIEFLAEHIKRLTGSAEELKIPLPDKDWEGLISQCIEKNDLEEKTARVKIILTRGIQPGLGLTCDNPPTLLITAVEQKQQPAPEKIGVYPEKRMDPVSKHKSLNYLYNLIARDWAAENGYDEAVLIGSRGEILECTMSNIFIKRENILLRPLNEGLYLDGIMGAHFIKTCREEGMGIEQTTILLEDIQPDDEIYITNSMIGICKVTLVKG
jgi:branched-subunit amino acid aminotransferase/4-amino-4-deoxychorismate lyase